MCEAHAALVAAGHTPAEVLGAREFAVQGMTCEHCATSVTEEVEQVRGVKGIHVDLAGGKLLVVGDEFTDDAIRDAVDEAGYALVEG